MFGSAAVPDAVTFPNPGCTTLQNYQHDLRNRTCTAFLLTCILASPADISRAGGIVAEAVGLPLPAASALFAGAFGALCYFCKPKLLDTINGGLVVLVVASFVALLGIAGKNCNFEA